MLTTSASFGIHNLISLSLTHQSASYLESFSVNTFFNLTKIFSLGYGSKFEDYKTFDQVVHSINIGVNF